MKRILLTADPELPVPPTTYGGIERIVADLTTGLRGRGYRVGLVAHVDSAAGADSFFPWAGRRSQRAADSVRNCRVLSRAVRRFRPHLLHSFSRLLYMLPLLPRRLPKVMSYQRSPSRRTTAWARRLARGTLRFTGCSEYICRLGRASGGSWTAVPNFVDVRRYTFRPAVPESAPLVFLSRVEAIKGAHVAIAVARRAGRRLVIAGNHADDGPGGQYWRERVEPHIGRDGIEYVGPVDDRQKDVLLGRAAALLVPVQWDEPFGIVFAEALACGTPVISCPRGALPEIVRSGIEGYLGTTDDDLVAAVRALSGIDRRNCRARAEWRFSSDRVIDEYEQIYAAAVGPRPEPTLTVAAGRREAGRGS